jgi:photosystem II stability/assembly factor-like uncharacterized protein
MSPNFATDRTIFAGTEAGGVLRSTNGGTAWKAINEGLGDLSVNWLVLSPEFARDRRVIAGTSDGVYRSTDAGDHWERVAPGSALTLALAGPSRDKAVAFAGLANSGVLRSENGWDAWEAANQGLAGRLIVGLWVSPGFADDRTLFTTSLDLGVERSTDLGATWQQMNAGLPSTQVPTLGLSPAYASDRTLFAGCADGVFTSADGGDSWQRAGEDLAGVDVRTLAVSPDFATDRTLFVATGDNRILRSTDAGATWAPLRQQIASEEIVSLVCAPGFGENRVLYVGTYAVNPKEGTGVGAVWRGDEAGDKLSMQTTYHTNNRWVAFGVPATFAGSGMFFVGIHNAVLRPMVPSVSAEGFSRRRVWKAEPVAPVNGSVVALAASPKYADDRTIFAATSHGVYKSETGGLSWKAISEGLVQKSIVAIALSPTFPTDRQVFALSLGGDLWRYVDRSDN